MSEIDWTKPLELLDGTPVVFDPDCKNPDSDGDYYLSREDRMPFTYEQTPGISDTLIVGRKGTWWLDRDGRVLVRNRTTHGPQNEQSEQPERSAKTLRDEFAMIALANAYGPTPQDIARLAYAIADAMLAERVK